MNPITHQREEVNTLKKVKSEKGDQEGRGLQQGDGGEDERTGLGENHEGVGLQVHGNPLQTLQTQWSRHSQVRS
jgi:hypothetical protein